MIDLGHDLAFAAHALGLVVVDELPFDLDLEGVGLSCLSVGCEPHLSEGPRAEECVPFELHDVDGPIELVHPLPVLLVAHTTQVQNDAVDIGQGELPEHTILQHLHRLSTLLHPSLPPELLVLVRHERVLPEERSRLENPALAIVRVRFQHARSHEEERGSVDVIPLGQNLPLGRVLHLVDQRAHELDLEVLDVGFVEEGYGAQQSAIVRTGDDLGQRPEDLLEHLARQSQGYGVLDRRGVRLPRFVLHDGLFAEVIPGPQDLDAAFPMFVLHLPLPNDVEHAPLAPAFEDLIPRIVIHGSKRIGNPMNELVVQIAQKRHLPQHVLRLIIVLDGVRRQKFAEGDLIDPPQSGLSVHGHARRGAGGVVQQRQLSEGIPGDGASHLVPVDDERHLPAAEDVKVSSRLALLDNGFFVRTLVILEGIHQGLQFALVERIEDEVVRQCIQ
mmetsp:Transcript_20462/g.36787  ORF Transcript_20462/g.36787 Transcript_20462/m.36787 type:complete len:445 (+) Transcript_20462:1154-2488(+)